MVSLLCFGGVALVCNPYGLICDSAVRAIGVGGDVHP